MSEYTYTPAPPRPATQQEVTDQINQLRRQLEQQLRQAQQEAANQASKRVVRMQEEQIKKIRESINELDEASRRNIENMDRRHREQLETITQRIYDDIEKSQKRIEIQVNHQISDLASDVSNQIQGLDTKIQKQQRDIRAINEQMEIVVKDIDAMAQIIDERFKENERSISAIQDDLASIHQHFRDEDEKAIQAVNTARNLLGLVEQRTLLDRFAPGYEAQDLRQRIDDLDNSPLNGASLRAKAEEAITLIWQTERHAIQEKAKHDAMIEIALTQIEKVLTVVHKNREINYEISEEDLKDNPKAKENDWWSDGEYGRLSQELEKLKMELENRYNEKLTKQKIEEILQRSAEIENRILQINAESVAKAILSEKRVETMEDLVNAMEAKGWTIKNVQDRPEFGYLGGEEEYDWRESVCAVLENNVGEEITVLYGPVFDRLKEILVIHQESNNGITDKKTKEQYQAILEQLCDLGIKTENEEDEIKTGVAHIPEMGSADRLGRAHSAEHVRQIIQQ